jgi:hypothetical protein
MQKLTELFGRGLEEVGWFRPLLKDDAAVVVTICETLTSLAYTRIVLGGRAGEEWEVSVAVAPVLMGVDMSNGHIPQLIDETNNIIPRRLTEVSVAKVKAHAHMIGADIGS